MDVRPKPGPQQGTILVRVFFRERGVSARKPCCCSAMSKFEPVHVTGPARELKPKRVGASYVLPIAGSVTTEWQDAFKDYPWTFNALKERRPRVYLVDGVYGIGLALSVFEAPATPWPILLDGIEAAIEEINKPLAEAAESETARLAASETEHNAAIAAAQAAIDTDWRSREPT